MKTIDVAGVEVSRTYVFKDGFEYTVVDPKTVYITDQGSHRIADRNGQVHYVGGSWRVIKWVPVAGQPEVIA